MKLRRTQLSMQQVGSEPPGGPPQQVLLLTSALLSGAVRQGHGGAAAAGGPAGGPAEGSASGSAGQGPGAEGAGESGSAGLKPPDSSYVPPTCVLLQVEKNVQSSGLLKDLYLENAQLMKALQVTERRQKQAEKRNRTLEDKVGALNQLLKEVVATVLST